ncbi:MAG: hypothetical protein ABW063_11020 [Caulobacter sp.]
MIGGQAVNALDVEVAGRDGDAVSDGLVGLVDAQQGVGRRVAVEADEEAAGAGGSGDLDPVQADGGAGRGLPEQIAALTGTAYESEGRCGGEGRRRGDRERAGQQAAAVQERVSCQRCSASDGPA